MTKTYSRPCIAAIQGYVPGEQPRGRTFVKLNTNENPYPPSAKTMAAAKAFDLERLRLYSEPSAIAVRQPRRCTSITVGSVPHTGPQLAKTMMSPSARA